MAILNYTTSIDAYKTAGEIMRSLAAAGATQIGIDYQDGEPSAISFMLVVRGSAMLFRLPSNHRGVLGALQKATDRGVTAKHRTEGQARRVAWRIVKDWTEAQLAIIEAQVALPEQVFLPYAVTDDNRTLFDRFTDNPGRLLGPASKR